MRRTPISDRTEGDLLSGEGPLYQPIEDEGVVEAPATIPIVATEDHNIDAVVLADATSAPLPGLHFQGSAQQRSRVHAIRCNQPIVFLQSVERFLDR